MPGLKEKLIEDLVDLLPQQRPIALIVCGNVGTGKTWLAQNLVSRFGFRHFNTDAIRKNLTQGRPRYNEKESELTYRELTHRALAALGRGEDTILDGTFLLTAERKETCGRLLELGFPFTLVLVTAPVEVIRSRLEQKRRRQLAGIEDNPSDADLEVLKRFEERLIRDPRFALPSPEEGPLLVVDTHYQTITVKGG